MSGLLRNLYSNIYSNLNGSATEQYQDPTLNCIYYDSEQFLVEKPTPLIINDEVVPIIKNMYDKIIYPKSYPTEIKISNPEIQNHKELLKLSENGQVSLEDYVVYMKSYLKRHDNNYSYKKLYCNPVEFKIKLNPIKFICRASYKLANIDFVFNIMQNDNNFVDLCGGPGGFSEYLLATYKNSGGVGITLKSDNASLDWNIKNFSYKIDRSRFVITYGRSYLSGPNFTVPTDETGDLTDINNIMALRDNVLKSNGDGVHLVTADGAKFSDDDEELDSVELSQLKLFIAEIFTATQILKKGGNFVLKVFKTKYLATQSMLVILASLFEEAYIFKPITSRVGNSERYFIGLKFKYSPQDKIHFDFFKECLSLDNHENYTFVEDIENDVAEYFYNTSLENLQRQYVFLNICMSNSVPNWKNYISLKKLWKLFF